MKTNNFTIKISIGLLLILIGTALILPLSKGSPAFAQASYQTPTPDTDGRILYTVQEGDNCTRIFLLTGVTIEELISLNGLDEACTIFPGDKLLLGTVTPPTQAPTSAGPTEQVIMTPTPTSSPGFAKLCIVLFNDVDGTGMRTEDELYLEGGQVSLNNRLGTVSKTGTTVGGDPELVEPLCFEDIPEGDYNITIAIPDGYNATTITNFPLTLKAGNQAVLDFGAQVSTNIPVEQVEAEGGRSPILAILGGVILVSGLGLSIYMWRSKKAEP